MYKLIKEVHPTTGEQILTGLILRENDAAIIPPDPANIDYRQYLAWLEEGNVPEEWNPEGAN